MTARGKRSVGPRPLRARLYVVPVLLAIVTAASCSSDDAGSEDSGPDLAAFRREAADLRGSPFSAMEWREYVDLGRDTCADDRDVFGLTYVRLLDEGPPLPESMRLQVRYLCPDRLDELDEIDAIGDAVP